jgi:hypothetical protein
MASPLDDILAGLQGVKRSGDGYVALCPAHDDHEPSLSVTAASDGSVLVHCHGGCSAEAVMAAIGLELSDLFPAEGKPRRKKRRQADKSKTSTAQGGCTIAQLAEAKLIDETFMAEHGWRDMSYLGAPAVRIPYLSAAGSEVAVRFRIALSINDRFRWRKGSHPTLYGLPELAALGSPPFVVIVEGETDTLTLQLHDIPVLGLPGADTWVDAWLEHLGEIPLVYFVIEPDRGGQALLVRLAKSAVRDRLRIIKMTKEAKDPNELYRHDPANFKAAFQGLIDEAVSWAEHSRSDAQRIAAEAWESCQAVATCPDILEAVSGQLLRAGLVGEKRLVKLLYLAVTSRLLGRPISVLVKGSSASGKSHSVEEVLRLFPENASYCLTAMSEKYMAYLQEPLVHRMLVIYENAGVSSEFASYVIRSLLSEGHIRYGTIMKVDGELQAVQLDVPGPTGLILTTTSLFIHDENETRMLSVPTDDRPAQTRAVLAAIAAGGQLDDATLEPWRALQVWLEHAEHEVVVPFAGRLAELVPPVAVRLRRDFTTVLALSRTHAMLHQASRARDAYGRVVATFEDYETVRELIADLLAESAEVAVPRSVRETVAAVQQLKRELPAATQIRHKHVAKTLGMEESSARRRVLQAIRLGYLANETTIYGRPADIVIGEPLPEEGAVLPRLDEMGTGTPARFGDPDVSPLPPDGLWAGL